jgi:hypothetical protein
MESVAIMQPYFMPYAGYFRLFAAADLFVIYDCVQFPRRGWVHRNRLPDTNGEPAWLTLPLAKAPREVVIRDLKLGEDADSRIAAQLRRFPSLAGKAAAALVQALAPAEISLVDYLDRLLHRCCDELRLPFNVLRSSTLRIDPGLHGAERIVAIARALGARRYVNAPGGRALYDPAMFAAHGIELRFLSDYDGPTASILHRLATESGEAVGAEIRART